MTVGPWKPISLHLYHARITDLDIRSKISESFDISLSIDCTISSKTPGFAIVVLRDQNAGGVISGDSMPTGTGEIRTKFQFSPGEVDLWFPVGYGKQPIYTVEVQISDAVIISIIIHILKSSNKCL
jgi:beta-mannosidase